ncbi:Hypothetical protein, putative [Bodo saltans]|uniref:Uncharacterized protein n=1 Tax=Bodo saltans TaxID=75058 RepID=A0A0S4JW02_BODSA|nr:Hypothetical protein, putative [Bodo saltans]|eukprot:CUG92743.1 Hypothetical protein, putative [Bodo saltans]
MDSSIFVQRLGALEDLMRKSEGSISHMITRLKEVELAVNTVVKQQEKTVPEVRYLFDEMNNVKRQVTTIDQTWRQTYTDFSGSLQSEIRGRIPQQIDTIAQQLRQENVNMKTEVQETHQLMRRATEQWNHELHDIRQIVQTSSWKSDQLQTTLGQQHQQLTALERRMDQDSHDLRTFASEVERNATSFRQFVESAVRAAHADLVQRVDVEQRGREGLQQDVQSTITRLRDDVQRGLAHSSATSKVLEENVGSLEAVLRAEVRSRISKTEELQTRFEHLASEMERDASSAAQVLQGLDDEGGAMHHTLQSTQTRFDKLWDEVQKLKRDQQNSNTNNTATKSGGGGGGGIAAPAKKPLARGTSAAPNRTMTGGVFKSDKDPILAMLDLDEEELDADLLDNEDEDITPELLIDITKESVHQATQGSQRSNVLVNVPSRRTTVPFHDGKMEKDQSTIEESLIVLREQLKNVQKSGGGGGAARDGVQSAGSNSARGSPASAAGQRDTQYLTTDTRRTSATTSAAFPNNTTTVRSSSVHSASSNRSSNRDGGSSGEETPRSATSRRSSATSNTAAAATATSTGQPIRRSRPPSENPNVMKRV